MVSFFGVTLIITTPWAYTEEEKLLVNCPKSFLFIKSLIVAESGLIPISEKLTEISALSNPLLKKYHCYGSVT